MFNRGFMSDATLTKVQQLAAVASEIGLSMPQLALAWCLRLQGMSSVVPGATLGQDALARIEQILA